MTEGMVGTGWPRRRELFLAACGRVTLFVQLPIVKMILDDPQVLYLGAWDGKGFFVFSSITFLALPGAVALLFVLLAQCSRRAAVLALLAVASYLLVQHLHYHYLLVQYTTAAWRRYVVLGLWTLSAVVMWKGRRQTVELLKTCSVFGVAVWGWFALQASPAALAWASHAPTAVPAPKTPMAKVPVLFLTFEKIVTSYVADEEGRILAERFPNLARFVAEADYYPHAYANTGATTYSLKTLYTGRVLTVEKNWRQSPNLRDILAADRHVVMVLDTMDYCEPSRDTCIRTIGVTGAEGLQLISGWYKTYAGTVLPARIQATLSLLGWRFDPRTTMWNREEGVSGKGGEDANAMAHKSVGARQLRELADAARQAGGAPNLYVMHNYITDGPGATTSVLTGRTEIEYRQDLETARANLATFDEELGTFLDTLKEAGIYHQALILMTADTGHDPKLMYVKGEAQFPSATEMSRVFLAIKRPEQTEGRVIGSVMRHIDVLPTVLEDLGIDPDPYRFQGRAVTDPSDTANLAQRPLEFVIPTASAGIIHYQLTDPDGPYRRMAKRALRW